MGGSQSSVSSLMHISDVLGVSRCLFEELDWGLSSGFFCSFGISTWFGVKKDVWSFHGETVGLEDEPGISQVTNPGTAMGSTPRRSNLITYNLLLNACDSR